MFHNKSGVTLNLSEPFCFIDGYEDSYTEITSRLTNLQRLGLKARLTLKKHTMQLSSSVS
nr:MAG TPA: hypothetical protein [Caudoviricetes sp.]